MGFHVSGLVGFQVSDNIFIGAAYDYQTSDLKDYSNGSYELIFRFDVLSKQAKAISPRFFLKSQSMKQFKINTYIILVGALMMISSQSLAQKSQMNLVNKEFDKYAFMDAREVLLKLTDEGFESDEVFKSLADTYYYNSQYDDMAAIWYDRLISNYLRI